MLTVSFITLPLVNLKPEEGTADIGGAAKCDISPKLGVVLCSLDGVLFADSTEQQGQTVLAAHNSVPVCNNNTLRAAASQDSGEEKIMAKQDASLRRISGFASIAAWKLSSENNNHLVFCPGKRFVNGNMYQKQ